ncbi:pyrroline-5-carboxylate reductase [Kitasatospora sp. NPDC094019]|uniref:pyrroline-5-carboxylate reductase n=1 Tax=Kitasatospora sp. NPDC094019 TaxID=3364091 RepID=UPI0037FA8454
MTSSATRGQKIAFLGTGKIGEALLSGLLRAGKDPADVLVTARRPERAAELAARYGVGVVGNAEAAKLADTLILAVKPQDMGTLLDELAPHIDPDRLVISAAAGIPTAWFEARLAGGTPVVRVMPNTPVLVDEGMSVISGGSHAAEAHLERAEEIFRSVGKALRLPESQQDAATALSGSGPAYFYFLVEAMTDAGILLGLPRQVAHDLIVQSAIGASVMLRDSGEHPVKLREAVTSPAGTTIAAIRELENHGVRAALLSALEAARDRSRELASGGR